MHVLWLQEHAAYFHIDKIVACNKFSQSTKIRTIVHVYLGEVSALVEKQPYYGSSCNELGNGTKLLLS